MLAICSVPFCAQATTTSISIFSNPGAGSNAPSVSGASYSAALSFDDVLGKLTIDITNTSLASIGGDLTAFVFNLPDGLNYTASSFTQTTLTGSPDPFAVSTGASANPYGTFDILTSATGGDFEGGGQPKGLAVGESMAVSYLVTSLSPLSNFTIADFVAATTSSAKGSYFFVARFRGIAGLEGLGSDKLPAITSANGVPAVPVPAALPLLGSAIGALGGFAAWKRRRKAAASYRP